MLRFHVEARLCRYAPSLLPAIGSICPHPIRPQCHVSPPSVGTHPSIGSKIRILACCSKRSPRLSLLKVRNLMFQAFPAEAWSTRAAVNQSFSEALRGGERKSQRGRFRLASPAVRVGYRLVVHSCESCPRGVGSRPRGEAR